MSLLLKTLVVVVFGVVVFSAVRAGAVHDQVLADLESKLDETFVGSIEADRLTGSLWWGFTAHDVWIRDSRGELVAFVDEFRVDASAYELLRGDIRFDRAQFIRPVILVQRYADGTENISRVFKSRDLSSDPEEPSDRVVFEMAHAEIVDGRLVYIDPADSVEDRRVVSAEDLDLAGEFRVLSGGRIETLIGRLDADVVVSDDPTPRAIEVTEASAMTGVETRTWRVENINLDDHWHVDDLMVEVPRSSTERDPSPIQLRGRASMPEAGWLQFDGEVDPRDDSYRLSLEADDFETAGWPGAPDWRWLVLDGSGELSGRGWSREQMDATLRWTAADVELAGEHLDELRLTASLVDERLIVDKLEIASADSTASLRGHLDERGGFSAEAEASLVGRSSIAELFDTVGVDFARPKTLRLTAKADGRLDLDGAGFEELLDYGTIETIWTARNIALGEGAAEAAGGSIDLRVPSRSRVTGASRKYSYEATAAVRDYQHGDVAVELLHGNVEGHGRFAADHSTASILYDLELEAGGVRMGEQRTAKMQIDIAGRIKPAEDGARWPLQKMSARGRLDMLDFRVDEVRADRVAANIDVEGEFPLGVGTIEAYATGLRTDDKEFKSSRVRLRLLDGEKFRLESKAKFEFALGTFLPLYLDISGRHGRHLEALTLDKLEFGRPGMRWKIREPGLVLFEDDAVVLRSLTLRRMDQKVRLDGAYGRGKKGSISAICSRLERAQLRSFFDVPKRIIEGAHDEVIAPVGEGIKKGVLDPIGRGIRSIF